MAKLKPFLIILAGFFIINVGIFWKTLAAIPSLANHSAFIARDELVPFFDWHTQFLDQIVGSEDSITYSSEVRVSYSFWTSWLRYESLLPIGLVVLSSLTAFLIFLSVYFAIRHAYPGAKQWHLLAASCIGTLPVFLILLYSKVTHFSTLLIGYGLFALALTLFLQQFVFKPRPNSLGVALLGVLLLLNPAVHYHLLILMMLACIIPIRLILLLVRRQYRLVGALMVASLILAGTWLIPYLIIIQSSAGSVGSGSSDIPVNYWMIKYNSPGASSLFSFDTTAQIDFDQYGQYLRPTPRYVMMLLFVIACAGVIRLMSNDMPAKLRRYAVVYLAIMLLALFMAGGYGDFISFHNLAKNLPDVSAALGAVGDLWQKGLYMFVKVLRFPHRFQFLAYFSLSQLLAITAMLALKLLPRLRPTVVLASLGGLVLIPFALVSDYRGIILFGGGDMAGFLRPYHVPDDLAKIKQTLATQRADTKLFILPSLEGGTELRQDGARYSFIDKALIYYLNAPTYYYGAGSGRENKVLAYQIYQSISRGDGTWEPVLANSIGATHILVPKQAVAAVGRENYFPKIYTTARTALDKSHLYHRTFDGPTYALYERNTAPTGQPIAIDVPADQLAIQLLQPDVASRPLYFPPQYHDMITSQSKVEIRTNDPARAYYTMLLASGEAKVVRPHSTQLPFNPSLVESSVFTASATSLAVLSTPSNEYNLVGEVVPGLLDLVDPAFVATTRQGGSILLTIPPGSKGKTRLVLRASSLENQITTRLGTQDVVFQRLSPAPNKTLTFDPYVADLDLGAGQLELSIPYSSHTPILVDNLLILPQSSLPDFQASTLAAGQFAITKGTPPSAALTANITPPPAPVVSQAIPSPVLATLVAAVPFAVLLIPRLRRAFRSSRPAPPSPPLPPPLTPPRTPRRGPVRLG